MVERTTALCVFPLVDPVRGSHAAATLMPTNVYGFGILGTSEPEESIYLDDKMINARPELMDDIYS